ncbi:MAG: hypothetical protein HQM13_19710 [SAR324 cluster bacterium]|nr:hypothetical protein [SAR324 cluster bacterium]
MRLKIILMGLSLFCIGVLTAVTTMAQEKKEGEAWYVGSEKCQECHMDEYSEWHASGHPWKLRRGWQVKYTPLPLPKGYVWDDISYVIGGATKKARFIDNEGYIITTAKDGSPAKTQYNIQDGSWSNYHPGEKKPYKCGPCHMSAYSPVGHQDGLPGMIGTWVENGVGCEECHGPGSTHTYQDEPSKDTIIVDASGQSCGKCHQRSGTDIPPLASGGFVRHHEQFNEVDIGAHEGTDCTECHDPHKRADQVKKGCSSGDCHSEKEYVSFAKETIHGKAEINCIECHMPKATKSAIKTGRFAGDVRTHMVKINVDPAASMFKDGMLKGKKVVYSQGFVTLDFACLNCHGSKDKMWAAKNAKDFHKTEY